MNIIERSRKAIKAFSSDTKEEEVLANGVTIDKRDVEDPTNKFCGTRYASTVYNGAVKRNVDFFRPEYDLPTIANAIQMDGLLHRARNIFVEQILKNGYEFISKNEDLQKHVFLRFKEIQSLTGIPLYETMTQIATQLVSYANAYIIKVRDKRLSAEGRPFRLYGKNLDPVVGLFVADATTMEIGVNKNTQVVNYKQTIRGKETYWDERDVIHITYNKIPGTLTGMSPIVPILDDVRALRKLEEEIEILGFQYSIPLYLYKVGTKDQPPAPNEIEQVTSTVNHMPAYGMLVVPGHHTIEVPTNNNTPVDLISFVQHFKTRIYSGLGVSPIAMGEVDSSNRNTAESLDLSMQTITKQYQQILKNSIEMDLIREFMLDGGYDTTKDEVIFSFPEIDLENQVKKENAIIQKFQNNLITRSEARLELDYEKTIDESDTLLEVVTIPEIEAKNNGALMIAEVGAKAKAASAKSTSMNGAKKKSSNSARPTNQHGTSSGRPRIRKDFVAELSDSVNDRLATVLGNSGYRSNLNVNVLSDKISSETKTKLRLQLKSNLKAICEYHHIRPGTVNLDLAQPYLDEVELLIKDKIRRVGKKVDNDIKLGVLSDDVQKFIDLQKEKTFNLAKMLVYKSLGFKTILVEAKDCDNHILTNIDSDDLSYLHIPPFRYSCKCSVDEESLNEFKI